MKKNRSKLTTADKVIDSMLVGSLGVLCGAVGGLSLFTAVGAATGATGGVAAVAAAGSSAIATAIASGATAIGLAAGVASVIGLVSVGLITAAFMGVGAFLAYKYAKDAVNKRINAKLESLEKNKQNTNTKEKTTEKGNEINNTKENNKKKNTPIQVSDPQNLDSSITENKSKQM